MESVQAMSPSDRAYLMVLLDKLMSGMMPANDGPSPMLFQEERNERKKATKKRRPIAVKR